MHIMILYSFTKQDYIFMTYMHTCKHNFHGSVHKNNKSMSSSNAHAIMIYITHIQHHDLYLHVKHVSMMQDDLNLKEN